MTTNSTPVTVAYGDGIGPEIVEAVLSILRHANAPIAIEAVEIGKRMFEKGYKSGIGPDMYESLARTKILLKGPITTPQGGGFKSLNVTLRKALGLYANIRPCIAYSPYIATAHPKMDLVIVRENEEDLYTGIEYRHTTNLRESIKLISRTGCERIIRYAFEYAVKNNRKKVTCFSKDNIMKMTDGLFHQVFNEIAQNYPNVQNEHYIIDIGTARLATKPEIFDVVVTSNLYGDIISDVVAEISGSVGLAGSANIGQNYSMFEAIHGSAPDIAGQNIANPSGLLHAAIMMLVHIGATEVASAIHNAWYVALEEGMHTSDIYNTSISKQKLGTKEFAEAVIARLGREPSTHAKVQYASPTASNAAPTLPPITIRPAEPKLLVGVDIYVEWRGDNIKLLADAINTIAEQEPLQLQVIAAMGLAVWPNSVANLPLADQWCLRFVPKSTEKVAEYASVISISQKLSAGGFEPQKTENLYVFGDTLGFSQIAGE